MVEARHTEQRLTEELADTRAHLGERLLLLRRDLDIGRHVVRSTEDHPFELFGDNLAPGRVQSQDNMVTRPDIAPGILWSRCTSKTRIP
jgi:hypothetical protein